MEDGNSIRIRLSVHRDKPVWLLYFPYGAETVQKIKQLKGSAWSRTKRCWYGPGTADWLKELKAILPECKFMEEVEAEPANTSPKADAEANSGKEQAINAEVDKFIRQMQTERNAASTVKTYAEGLRLFLNHVYPARPEALGNDDVNRFLHEYAFQQNLSRSWHRTLVSALRFYFRRMQGKVIDPEQIRYPKKDKLLPRVLDQKDIEKMLRLTTNIKHRCMLSLIYACGLRRGDLLRLKIHDIDGKRLLLFVHGGKGNKDRVVGIPQKMVERLREYYRQYQPKEWLFEGQVAGEPYSERSLQMVLKQALKRAGLREDASLHWLRHSFATHTLESGVDIAYIKELLGHSSIRTTEIYTHVSREKMRQIRSPFEDLDV